MIAAAVISGLVLWTLLAVLIALAGLGQVQPHMNYGAVPGWFWYYRNDAKVMGWLGGAYLGVALLAGGLTLAAFLKRKPELHGSARFANERELMKEGLRSADGIIVGRKDGRFVRFGGPEHVMLYAPTRSGKGVGVVIPNLLSWADSVVVLDMKQENYEITGRFRADNGQSVYLFDPLSPDGRTARYNPLSYIDTENHTEVIDELQKIASMLFPVLPKQDPFWAESARTGFIGIGGYVAATGEGDFTLGEIYRWLTSDGLKERLKAIIKAQTEHRSISRPVLQALSDFGAHSDKTFSGVKGTVTSRLGLFINPRVDYATSHSDFDLRDLRKRRVSIYLGVSPDNIDRVAPLYNLFFQQLVDLNTRAMPGDDDKYQVLMLLDEFARLGRANVIAKGFSYVAGYKLRLLPVIQSPSQLSADDAYGRDGAEEILTNCGVEIIFTPKELKVAEELSRRLGTYTVGSKSRSRPVGFGKGNHSTSESDQSRALMMPQELMQMPRTDCIVIRAGIPPIRGKKITYYDDADFMKRVLDKPGPVARNDEAWDKIVARMAPQPRPAAGPVGEAVAREDGPASTEAPATTEKLLLSAERTMKAEEIVAVMEAPASTADQWLQLANKVDLDACIDEMGADPSAFDRAVGDFFGTITKSDELDPVEDKVGDEAPAAVAPVNEVSAIEQIVEVTIIEGAQDRPPARGVEAKPKVAPKIKGEATPKASRTRKPKGEADAEASAAVATKSAASKARVPRKALQGTDTAATLPAVPETTSIV